MNSPRKGTPRRSTGSTRPPRSSFSATGITASVSTGVPAGHEFATPLEDIRDVGRRDPKLTDEMMAQLARVDKPVHMQVMVLLTCPYCPKAVRTAHRFAMASEHITGDMIDATEFPDLAEKYS